MKALADFEDQFKTFLGLLAPLPEDLNQLLCGFKDLLRACPHHGFLELHQLDTFYNALNSKDQDSLNSTAGGNFLDKLPRECLAIIESKSKVCYSRNKPVVAKVSTNTSSGISPDVAELKDMVKALLLDKKSQNQAPATVKAVEESFNYNQGNTSYRHPMMSNQIRPPGFPPVPNNQNVQLNQRNNQNCFNQNQNPGNNFNHRPVSQPPVFQPPAYQAPAYQAPAPQTQGVSKEDFSAYVKANDAVMRNMQTQGALPSNTIANPRSDLKVITTRTGVSYDGPQILPPPSFLPKVVENEPEATKDTVNPTNNGNTEDVRPLMAECLSLADLVASINLMPLSVWNKLSLPNLTPTCMTLELVDRSISHPVGVAEDVYIKVGELTLRVGKEAITFNLDQTSRYSANYNDMTAKRINLIDMACEEYSQEVLEVELKYLPPHLEYAFLEGDDKFPVIIAKDLSVEEKAALITVLKSHERAIAWKLSDIKEGIVLGHKISKQEIEVDKAKVDVITKLPHPITVKGIQSFLGHADFYHRFIKDFSKIARLRTRPLEKDTLFIFNKDGVEALQKLKRKPTEAPILIAPDWDMPFELMCDASDFAISSVLWQRQDKHFRPIHYASKTMTEAESNYTTTKKEMLAVVYAFEKFWSYLIMNKSIVYTNHFALKYLFAKKDSKARLL
uniref:Reverse transcriptase domain-containing protein n=1 Tax=Tanacetum cinerariifolium TaxID=118510 RepID=A0A6L2P4Z1_TANCI|nr:reverse transcriptase domain-containing protein [Tanacetum cinerariifolium]